MTRSTAEKNARLVREYLEPIFEDNTYREELVSDEFVAHVPATLGGDGYTLAEREAVTAQYHAAFPDLAAEVEVVTATDETVVVRVRLTGTHEGEALGADGRLDHDREPTGAEIDVVGAAIVGVEAGEIAAVQWFVDKLQLLNQLGALPE